MKTMDYKKERLQIMGHKLLQSLEIRFLMTKYEEDGTTWMQIVLS
jgi:hypothetical protein